jgi:hypothetical protein
VSNPTLRVALTSKSHFLSDQFRQTSIVAVHGLNGNAIKTWTSDNQKICWLSHRDLLPKYLKSARILTWGYNANIASLMGKTTSSDRILQHAHTLVADLQADREVRASPVYHHSQLVKGQVVKRRNC